jgi:hypothetical protein
LKQQIEDLKMKLSQIEN